MGDSNVHNRVGAGGVQGANFAKNDFRQDFGAQKSCRYCRVIETDVIECPVCLCPVYNIALKTETCQHSKYTVDGFIDANYGFKEGRLVSNQRLLLEVMYFLRSCNPQHC